MTALLKPAPRSTGTRSFAHFHLEQVRSKGVQQTAVVRPAARQRATLRSPRRLIQRSALAQEAAHA
jgi:hypothetical protein